MISQHFRIFRNPEAPCEIVTGSDGNVSECNLLRIFDTVDKIRKQGKFKISSQVHLFLPQVALTEQIKILTAKLLGDFHHWNTMRSVILLRNGNIKFLSFMSTAIL